MIDTRTEKLRFIAEEMHIALHLATHAPDAFSARMLARHILIRAENFIAHARGLRKPLNLAGYDTRDFHKTKEAYAAAFDEYFQLSRDRLGAHVQDFDFGKRIELWNDIEIIKIGFFVDGAKELYQSLASMRLPGYVPYADPSELTDSALNEALSQFFRRSDDNRHRVEIGVDPLALTRENTSALLNMSLIHQRAGQLALIRRWIAMQTGLLEKIAEDPRIVRILKGRIITDIVSFCDCLVTRSVPAGAPQEMDGLDKLISASGQSPAPINDFVAASTFQSELQAARAIRDEIGAHLEIDASRTLNSLIANLDGYDLDKAHAFYALVERAFAKACHSILYLRMYAADGQRLYGVTAVGAPSVVPFSGDAVPTAPAPRPPINDEEAYRRNLTQWLDGDEAQKGDARQFFWNAFSASEIVEQIHERETFGAGTRISTHEIRKAHQFIAASLAVAVSDSDFGGILDLLLTCGRGSPYPLAEILVRYARNTSESRQWLICYALGEIASWPHASVTEFLEARMKAAAWGPRLQATLALFKTFVTHEGVYRTNNKGKTRADYDAFAGSLTAAMAAPELLVCSLALASILSGPRIGSFSQPFADNYSVLQAQIQTLCVPYLKDDKDGAKTKTLKQLIQTHDYVGVCVLLAADLQENVPQRLREALTAECCNGSIAAAAHDQAYRHLAMCFLLKKQHGRALEIAEGIANRNPDNIAAQILVAQILADMPGSEDKADRKIAGLRRLYKLDAGSNAALASVERELARRKASPQ